MKKALIIGFFLLAFPVLGFAVTDYNPKIVGAGNPELHIKPDGSILIRSARVDQVVGSTLYVGLFWGDFPMRFTMKTDARTAVTKRYGGNSAVSHLAKGDYLDIDGELFIGSDFFGVNALKVKDWSLQEESGTFSGVITEVFGDRSFNLKTPQSQMMNVRLGTSSPSIKKGSVEIPFERLKKGDTIVLAAGIFDYSKNLLTADRIIISQAKTEFLPRNFEGVLKQVVSATPPASLIVVVSGVEYTVKVTDKTPVQKKNRSLAQLARFVPGDTIRFYGAVREEEKTLADDLIVDAEVVRNLNL